MRVVLGAVLVAVTAAFMPVAEGDPGQFPDLSGFTEANFKDFTTFQAYTTSGVQFVTPGGYRCRMSYTAKASSTDSACWGVLPGTSHNEVAVRYTGPSSDGGTFSDVDLSAMEKYQYLDGTGWHVGTVSPDAYRLLLTHSKVSYDGDPSHTCAVDGAMTACVIGATGGGRHGFVLRPEGSWTF